MVNEYKHSALTRKPVIDFIPLSANPNINDLFWYEGRLYDGCGSEIKDGFEIYYVMDFDYVNFYNYARRCYKGLFNVDSAGDNLIFSKILYQTIDEIIDKGVRGEKVSGRVKYSTNHLMMIHRYEPFLMKLEQYGFKKYFRADW